MNGKKRLGRLCSPPNEAVNFCSRTARIGRLVQGVCRKLSGVLQKAVSRLQASVSMQYPICSLNDGSLQAPHLCGLDWNLVRCTEVVAPPEKLNNANTTFRLWYQGTAHTSTCTTSESAKGCVCLGPRTGTNGIETPPTCVRT